MRHSESGASLRIVMSVRQSIRRSVGPSHLTFFLAQWLIVSRARDLWRSALLKEDDIQMADDRLTGIVTPSYLGGNSMTKKIN